MIQTRRGGAERWNTKMSCISNERDQETNRTKLVEHINPYKNKERMYIRTYTCSSIVARVESMLALRQRSNPASLPCAGCAGKMVYVSCSAPVHLTYFQICSKAQIMKKANTILDNQNKLGGRNEWMKSGWYRKNVTQIANSVLANSKHTKF